MKCIEEIGIYRLLCKTGSRIAAAAVRSDTEHVANTESSTGLEAVLTRILAPGIGVLDSAKDAEMRLPLPF